jgi:dihydrofolate synthase/folylpolyglutamate synthase
MFTSPHLIEPTERIRINGRNVSVEQFARAFNHVHAVAVDLMLRGELEGHPSYFETVTAMGFCLFRDEHEGTAVVEVGLGGRLDATNVIAPELCVITAIDYDHEAWLGSTLEAIAGEKAGILKRGVPAVISRQRPEAAAVLDERASEVGSPVDHTSAHDVSVADLRRDGTEFRLDGEEYFCPLPGEHQVDNAAAAVLALKHFKLDKNEIRRSIAKTRWQGRLEKVAANPEIILDGAHNPAGARALACYLKRFFRKEDLVLIYGAMRDKSVDEVTEALFPAAQHVIATAVSSARALDPSAIAGRAEHPRVHLAADIREAIDMARGLAPHGTIIVTGSLYLVGEARTLLVK